MTNNQLIAKRSPLIRFKLEKCDRKSSSVTDLAVTLFKEK